MKNIDATNQSIPPAEGTTSSPSQQEPTPCDKNIYDLLLEIKRNQEFSDVTFESVIDDKMKDLKFSIGAEINNVKKNGENNSNIS